SLSDPISHSTLKVTNDLLIVLDTIDHHILEHFIGIKSTALNWIKSYLSVRLQFTLSSTRIGAGPKSIHLYMLPLGNIIRNHSINFHCYADDTQLYLSMKPNETNQLAKLQGCLTDINDDQQLSTIKFRQNQILSSVSHVLRVWSTEPEMFWSPSM
uniref:Reverse transcriptase domain-containing protein n=1 Tax=Lates calcarifer TaxID=8187 RepID=A0A4W6FLW9_LATCA